MTGLRDGIALIIRRGNMQGSGAESTADAVLALLGKEAADLDLAWLLDAGWLAQLGQSRAPDNSPAGYYVTVRRMGELVSVNFTGGTVAEAAAKAREWTEGGGSDL